jgi:hypothetical protein
VVCQLGAYVRVTPGASLQMGANRSVWDEVDSPVFEAHFEAVVLLSWHGVGTAEGAPLELLCMGPSQQDST